MKKIILLLVLVLMTNCSKHEDYQDELDLSNLDFTELNFGLNKKEITVKIDLNNQKQVNQFSNELISEIDKLIAGEKDVYYNFTLILDRKNKRFKNHKYL